MADSVDPIELAQRAGYAQAVRGSGREAGNPFDPHVEADEREAWFTGLREGVAHLDENPDEPLRYGFDTTGADHEKAVSE